MKIAMARSVTPRLPLFADPATLWRKPTQKLLDKIAQQSELDSALTQQAGLDCLDFIDQVFEQFNFTYQTSARERQNIPAQGRVLIIANQTLTSLHALALLRQITEIRRDVKLVVDEPIAGLSHLAELLIPGSAVAVTDSNNSEQIIEALEGDKAVILFPAGGLAKFRPRSNRRGGWRPDVLESCRGTNFVQ